MNEFRHRPPNTARTYRNRNLAHGQSWMTSLLIRIVCFGLIRTKNLLWIAATIVGQMSFCRAHKRLPFIVEGGALQAVPIVATLLAFGFVVATQIEKGFR